MQLAEIFKETLIFLDFDADSKEAALDKMVKAVEKAGCIEDPAGLKNALADREKLGTTGVGEGIAIPHARCGAVKDLTVAFFRSKNGVNFNAIDNKPVNLFFLLLAPVASGGAYLKLLAKISRLLRNGDFRGSLLEAQAPREVMEVIQENE
jgi:fructose-specific phosphotransferase system IIA component